MCVVAGVAALAASATAFSLDPQIMIDRALNSPTLTVRYTGVTATLVELRVNGESVATRTVGASKNSGETNFTINLTDLKDGDNEVEIRLFDRTGRLVAHDKTNISTEQSLQGPVFLTAPKIGSTVQGPVEIKLGFGQELRNTYVSFFVDGSFKSISNVPPFEYLWDTSIETNGWHELEAWAIDDSNTTHKTRKVRVFVNNPGGRTDRKGVPSSVDLTPSKNPIRSTGVTGNEAGLRTMTTAKNGKAAVNGTTGEVVPTVVVNTLAKSNKIRVVVSPSAGLKPMTQFKPIATSVQHMTPTGVRVATPRVVTAKAKPVIVVQKSVKTIPSAVLNTVATTPSLISISHGTRIPNIGSFAVVLDTQFVNFDVPTRVDNGVPMTPFRHLIEKAGGTVKWEHSSKSLRAVAEGHGMFLKIGDKLAKIDQAPLTLELAPYIDRGRTIVPVSFLRDALKVDVDYDKETGHVLITHRN